MSKYPREIKNLNKWADREIKLKKYMDNPKELSRIDRIHVRIWKKTDDCFVKRRSKEYSRIYSKYKNKIESLKEQWKKEDEEWAYKEQQEK